MHVVIFYSQRRLNTPDYDIWAVKMGAEVERQSGFCHAHSFRNADGFGVTLSYWVSIDSIRQWGRHAEHRTAQAYGRGEGYVRYRIEIAEITSTREFEAEPRVEC